jgi:hypothetical protein
VRNQAKAWLWKVAATVAGSLTVLVIGAGVSRFVALERDVALLKYKVFGIALAPKPVDRSPLFGSPIWYWFPRPPRPAEQP